MQAKNPLFFFSELKNRLSAVYFVLIISFRDNSVQLQQQSQEVILKLPLNITDFSQMNKQKLQFGRYDFAAFGAFTAYALCSLAIPLVVVAMGKELDFPLNDQGQGQAGVLHLVRSLAMIVTLLLCGSIAGRFGKRLSLGTSMLFMGMAIFFCAFVTQYWMLLPLLAIAGFCEGTCEGVASPFVQDLHPDAPERYMNVAHSYWSVGIVLSVVLCGGLQQIDVNWRWIIGGCGLLAMCSSIPFLLRENPLKRYPESTQKQDFAEVWRRTVLILKTPRFWVYSAGMFMGAGSEFCLTFWSAAYMELTFETSTFVACLGTGAIAAGMYLGRNLAGYFGTAARLPKILIGAGLGTIPASFLLTCIKPEYFPERWMLLAVIFIILFICGIGIAPFWPTLQVHGVKNMPELDDTLLYIYFSAWGIPGCGFFTWIIGVLGDHFTTLYGEQQGLKYAFLLIPASLVFFVLIVFLEHWVFKNKRDLSAGEKA